ncbi:MAG: hypothetical protein ACR2RB_10320, partial [Gammaproteobacteria bacterium]
MKIVRADDDPQLLVADASVLINFLAIDRIDLLAALPYQLIVTEHVEVEIDEGYPEQLARFRSANTDGVFQIVRVDHPKELRLFSKLQADGRLGLGECSALACAHCRGGAIAIDDKVAIKRANDMFVEMSILRTLDLMV